MIRSLTTGLPDIVINIEFKGINYEVGEIW